MSGWARRGRRPRSGPPDGYFDPDGDDGLVGDGLELVPDDESDDELAGGGVGVRGGDADGDGLGRSLVLPDGD